MTFSTLRGLASEGSGEGGDEGYGIPGSTTGYETPTTGSGSSGGTTTFYGDWSSHPTYTTIPTTPSGNASSGFNWGSFFQGILPTVFNDATKIGQQAIATPGTVIGPNGQVVTGGGVMSAPASTTAMNINAMMPVILMGAGGLLLIMVMKGRR